MGNSFSGTRRPTINTMSSSTAWPPRKVLEAYAREHQDRGAAVGDPEPLGKAFENLQAEVQRAAGEYAAAKSKLLAMSPLAFSKVKSVVELQQRRQLAGDLAQQDEA